MLYLLLTLILLTVLILLIFVLIKWILHFIHFYKYLKSIPSPPTYPIIGNFLQFIRPKETLKIFSDLFKKYNTKLLRINFGLKTGIYVKDYKFLEFVMRSNVVIHDADDYKFLSNWLGTGNLPESGDTWKQRRQMLTPELHSKIMDQFSNTFNKVGDVLLENLKREVQNEATDIHPLVNLYAVDIICETAFGSCVNAQTLADTNHFKSIVNAGKHIQRRIFNSEWHFDLFYKFSKAYRVQMRVLKFLRNFTQAAIAKKKQQFIDKIQGNVVHERWRRDSAEKTAFIDLLLRVSVNGSVLSDTIMHREVKEFIFEGHDMISSACSFLLFVLSKHQHIQEKVYREITDELGADEKYRPTFKDLERLKYLEMVIKETLRIYPPVPVITVDIKEDLQYEDITIPKGCSLRICTYQMHRDPDYFPDPEKFDPERFSKPDAHPNVFISFSAGPQNCIEHKFVMFYLKFTVWKVLRNFLLKPTVPEHKLEIEQLSALTSANGMLLKLEQRI